MEKKAIIETERLTLRRWQDNDIEPFIAMNSDPEVMRYFTGTLSAEQTRNFYEVIQKEFAEYGYGLYAAEEKISRDFMGFIGFHWARMDMDFCPCVEIGWRLAHRYWGKGYATEGAAACLQHGFEQLGLDKVYSFTAVGNIASQRVMQKIGLQQELFFDHPGIPEGHPQRAQVCYMKAATN